MSLWLLKGNESFRLDGIRMFGRPPVLAPPAWALAARVWEGIGASPERGESDFRDLARELADAVPLGTRNLTLVVPDGTRVGAWRDALEPVVGELNRRFAASTGAPSGTNLTLLVAGGVHSPLDPLALLEHLFPRESEPEKLLKGWRVFQNGDNGFASHEMIGRTPAGTPVRLHGEYLRSDWRILLGEISYHYFAGFGGGRKLVFPGLAEPGGIACNHRRALRFPSGAVSEPETAGLDGFDWLEPCAPGRLEGNPVHEDLLHAVALAPPDWAVTLVDCPPADVDPADPRVFPVEAVQGPYPVALDEAAALYDASHRVSFTKAPSLLVTDAGGAPRDRTFLQAHKSLQHAFRFVPEGSSVLLAAGCREGLGSATLARYAEDPAGFRPLAGGAENPLSVIHLQTLVALRRVTGTLRVALWSDLPDGTVRALGMEPVAREEEACRWCLARMTETRASDKRVATWGWLPRAERFLPSQGWLGGGL